ncbi:hypothetical protein H920_10112 [Fukomys damarensis]|uniref:Uncharacterized protein n=1 Tax=Fukomys damarensis TaxID=885580 RepID=A0A091DDZ1_FUKDA|nr:hypothetical protein H920_10112 [Fukomys damarensis]
MVISKESNECSELLTAKCSGTCSSRDQHPIEFTYGSDSSQHWMVTRGSSSNQQLAVYTVGIQHYLVSSGDIGAASRAPP